MKKAKVRASTKREARFQAAPWSDEDFFRIHTGIMFSLTLDSFDKFKISILLCQVHEALTGQKAVDPYLGLAAYTMGLIDIWNEILPKRRFSQTNATRMIARHLSGVKTARAIGAALKRSPYDGIRARCANDPRNVDCRVANDPTTAPVFTTVSAMIEADRVEKTVKETTAKWAELSAGFRKVSFLMGKASTVKPIPPGARGGRR